ncbi:MAG: ATP synthase F1 subunit epsilon [Tissierellia bacterium]|nr:ATP synthase F1 subunit epsilon [Tissierellia bacterium]
MKEFQIAIYAADKIFYEGTCTSLQVPTPAGKLGILANHRNIISAISPGLAKVNKGDEEFFAVVSNGLIKVEANKVLILVDTCERPEEIDEKRAERARREAERKLRQKMSYQEYHIAQANLSRALNRLKNSRKKDVTR